MSLSKQKYKEVVPAMSKEFSYENPMQVPKITKIVVNICAGKEAVLNSKSVNIALEELQTITGQRPYLTTAKKAISNFKLRQGMAIGCAVTLRGEKMWSFLDRLTTVALPRVRDFKGVSGKAFDGRGNYNLGMKEQIVFPEINYDKVEKLRGMNISICTTAKSDAEAKALLTHLGMPFRK